MKKNALKIIVTLISCLIFLSGCTANLQLHERLIIQGVCIDKINDECVLTLNIFDAEIPGGETDSKDQDSKPSSLITCKGKSVLDAFTSISNVTGKEPMYSQNLILVIGEDTAKAGVRSFIDFFVRHYQSRPSIYIFVSRGPASDIMEGKLNGKPITSKTISTLFRSSNLNMNVMGSNLVEFVSHIQNKISDSTAALLTIDEKEVTAKGCAVFHDDKLTTFLDADETKGALMINGNSRGGTEVVNIRNFGSVTYTIISSKRNLSTKQTSDYPVFNIEVNVDANVYEINQHDLNEYPEDVFGLMEEELNNHLEEIIRKSIDKCIIQNHCDIFDFGRKLMNTNPSYFKTIQNSWNDILPNIKYNIKVISHVNKTGQEISPVINY